MSHAKWVVQLDAFVAHAMVQILLVVRVLYTINASPQFLLARHRRRVQVLPITWHEESMEAASVSVPAHSIIGLQKFAKVPLKTCLGAVCSCR